LNPEQWQVIRRIFHQAIDLPSSERDAFILQAADGDESLRIEVQSLLASHDRAGRFIESGGGQVATVGLNRVHPDDMIGRRVGAYRIVREIGRGGMGAVYQGVRDDTEFSKKVAIKLIRTGMSTDSVVRRFLSERQILANLDHPNIARLLDGGTSEEGLPYFVMEYIEGQPLGEYCDTHRLATDERLRLFRDICSAVHFAHQNLVIHRDIKPGNLLVTPAGKVKLLDFGIAKLLLPGPGRDETTQAAARAMTPDYASPEQVRGDPITTSSDVYSLGVLLYELLTGHRPYRITTGSPVEIIRAICEQEPDKPSTAIARVKVLPDGEGDSVVPLTPESVSRARASQPDKLRRQLEGDLDNIVLKAMRKEPQRRYASAEQLSDDIRKYLEGMPVIARKDTFGYRATKFIKRHKAVVGMAVLVVVALVSAIIVTSWQAHIARRERAKSERRLVEQRRLANSLMTEVQGSLDKVQYAVPAQRLLAQKSLEYLNNLASDAGDDPSFLGELAAAYTNVAYFQAWTLQDNPGALLSYDKALELCKRRVALDPKNVAASRKLADVLGGKVESLSLIGRSEEALQVYDEEKLPVERSIFEATPQDPARMISLAESTETSGEILLSLGRPDEANTRFRAAAGLATQAVDRFKEQAHRPEELVDLSLCYMKLGDMCEHLGELQSAANNYRTGGVIAEAVYNEHPEIIQALRNTSASHWFLGQILDRQGDYQAALESFQVSLKTVMKAGDSDRSHYGEAKYSIIVGKALCKVGEKQEGLKLIRHGVEVAINGIVIESENSSASRYYGPEVLSWAGDAFNLAGRKDEAIRVYLEAIRLVEEAARKSPADANPLLHLTNLYESFGNMYADVDGDTRRFNTTNRSQLAEARLCYQKSLGLLLDARDNFRVSLTSSQEQVNRLQERIEECESRRP